MSNFTSVSEAFLVPVTKREDGPPGALVGGVYDQQGQFVEESAFYRTGVKMVYSQPLDTNGVTDKIDFPVMFGGYIYSHFGHFLLESISRLHVAREFPDLPIVWLKDPHLKGWQKLICQTLKLRNEHIFLSNPLRVPNLILGECVFSIRSFFKSYHAEFLGQYSAKTVPGRKIWLSRSKLAEKHGGIENDLEIESLLIEQGWDIFHSQEHSVDRQLEVLATAERIAGFEGSAFHLLILLKDVSAKVDIFPRGPSINPNYEIISKTKGFDQEIHFVEMEKISGSGSYSRYIVNDPTELYSRLF